MTETIALTIAFIVGALLMLGLLTTTIHGHLAECRAAHPGFDCDLGWVVSEPFK